MVVISHTDAGGLLSAALLVAHLERESELIAIAIKTIDYNGAYRFKHVVDDLLAEAVRNTQIFRRDTVELLAGRDYLEPIRPTLTAVDHSRPEFCYPFDETSGIDEQMGWLSEQIDQGSPMIMTDGGAHSSGGIERRPADYRYRRWTSPRRDPERTPFAFDISSDSFYPITAAMSVMRPPRRRPVPRHCLV